MKQKLIDQLLHKAGARFGAEGTDYSDFTSNKFAELILLEVTDILSTYRGKMVFEDGAEYNHEHPIIAIRKHFGVE